MSYLPPSYQNSDPHAIAIVGMSISAPGGDAKGLDTEAFYDFLKGRGSGIITVPADRWNADAYHGTAPGKICTTKGGYIPEFSWGDLQEFGITPVEAAQLATTQLVLLHQSFNALQRSGVDYRGTDTGVYVGCAGGGPPFEPDITQAGAYYMTGTSLSITANRINYVFDLLGPSLPVDTACSSSLTAMHLAVQAIRNGECDQAVVAGVNYIVTPLETASFSQLGVLSADGISKSFDDGGNGYARGDVASAVVIKRHDLAVRDKDRILATLVGSALTSCGSLMGSLTTPSPEAQTEAIRRAYRDAGLSPHQADFVELHGTGTVVGDSLEANAAGAVFSENRGGRELIIGSVKSNVGHGEMGAYMSSLVKVVMMLERKKVLPNGYFETPSHRIEFEKFKLRVPIAVEELVAFDSKQGIIASISSFGFGGSCGHTVLREHEPRPVHPDHETLKRGPFLFAFGALSPRAVQSLIQTYKEQYASIPPLALCEHLGGRARQMLWRTYAVGDSLANVTFFDPVLVGKRPNPLIFCFSGQGPQHWQQGRDLMAMYSVFRESIHACDRVYEEYTRKSFLEKTGLFIADAPESTTLAKSLSWPAEIISVAIAFFQIAMNDLLVSLGIKPDAIVGHSIGETAVLYASGAMPRDMAVKIATARGRALSKVDNIGGAMVAISGCDADDVRDYIEAASALSELSEEESAKLYMAAFNSPTDIGVSGSELLVDLLTKHIETWVDGVVARKLRVSTAVHSPYVDPCEASYRAELAAIFSQYEGPFIPTIPTMSTVTAEMKTDEYTINYLWRNLRQPVLFSAAIPKIVNEYGTNTTFVEISPHPVLSQYIKKMGALDSLPTGMRPPSARHLSPGAPRPTETHAVLKTIGQLLIYGINSINFSLLNGCPAQYFEGPAYPFQWKLYPLANREPTYLRRLLPPTRPLNSTRLRVSPHIPESWVSHHVIDHSILIPAAAYVEMALEFPDVTHVWDCRFESACILEEGVPPVTLEVAKEGVSWWVKSSTALQTMQGDLEWTRTSPAFDMMHAYGKLGYGKPELYPDSITKVDVDAVLKRCISAHDKDELYADLEGIAQFGPEFRRLKKAVVNENETICWIKGHADGLNATDYVFHPALMDAVFQASISWNMLHEKINVGGKDRKFLLPHSLKRAYRNDGTSGPLVLPEEFRIYGILAEWSPHFWTIDLYVLSEDNNVLFTFEGLHFEEVNQDLQWPSSRFITHWQLRELPATDYSDALVLDGPGDDSETYKLLHLLDQLAIFYTCETLKAHPKHLSISLPDRKRYLSWAQEQAKRGPVTAPTVDPILREQYASLFELTERVGAGQIDIIMTSAATTELLRDDIMNKIYGHPPFAGPILDETIKRFIELVKHAFAAGKRVVKVLEVGTGTGRLTSLLGQALVDAKFNDGYYVEYVASDPSLSSSQLSIAQSPWMTMEAKALDLNISGQYQGIDPASFDIIVSLDALHAVRDINKSLLTLHELLLPGGHLVAIDFDGTSFAIGAVGTTWADYVFGSFAEWMGVLDDRPASKYCSLSSSLWKSALDVAGFVDTLTLTSSSTCLAHLAFIAQAPPTQSAQTSPSLSQSPTPAPLTPPDVSIEAGMLKSLHDSSSISKLSDALEMGSTERPHVVASLESSAVVAPLPLPKMSMVPLSPDPIVYRFSAGGELGLVQLMSNLDATQPQVMWLYTDTTEGNCGLIGLVRSIRQEFSIWKILLVLFHPSWEHSQQENYICQRLMPLKWVDADVLVDEHGELHVTRAILAPAPPRVESRNQNPIEFDETQIWRAYPTCLGPQDVEVAVAFANLTPAFLECLEFSGQVTAVGADISKELVGRSVLGVADVKRGSVVVCHRSRLSCVPADMDLMTAAAVVGRVLFASSVVSQAISSPSTQTPRVILHAGNSSPASIATYSYLKARNIDVLVTFDNRHASPLAEVQDTHCQIFASSPCSVWSFHARAWGSKGVDVAFNFDTNLDIAKETIQLLSNGGSLINIGHESPHRVRRGQRYLSVDPKTILNSLNSMQTALDIATPSMLAALAPATEAFSLDRLSTTYQMAQAPSAVDVAVLMDLRTIDPQLSILRGGILKGTNAFDPRASYVIIGGVGGLGANIARCLVENGARHVVLTSRSGEDSFKAGRLMQEKKIISSLRAIPGVEIDIFAVDCLDAPKTKQMFASLSRRLAGVFYVAARLNDQRFTNLKSEDDWRIVHDVKVKGVKVLLEAVDPKLLDFLVLTSSMATVSGSPGQANYAAAQTEMEAIGSRLPNTVCVLVPPITDGGVFVRALPPGNARNAALDKYKALGMTGIRVATHCVDAIWSLNTPSEIKVYVPPVNWKKVCELGIPDYQLASLRHLLVKETTEVGSNRESTEQSIRATCAMVLSLEVDDLEENIPLSSYGLDSLTSVRLSGILKQYFNIAVTQLQLLSRHMTVEKLRSMQEEQRLQSEAAAQVDSSSGTADTQSAQRNLENDMDKTVVRLNDVTQGQPLFILHGAGGGILVLQKIAHRINVPVYGVQDTPEAPITGTMERLSRFYFAKIKEKQPQGPYRLAGFSFGTNLALTISQLLQAEGQKVDVLIMLDGAPTLFHRPYFREYTKRRLTEGTLRDDIIDVVGDMSTSGSLDGAHEITHQFADHFKESKTGGSGPKWVARFCKAYAAHVLMGVRASKEVLKREEDGTLKDLAWPTARTVLVSATNGVAVQPYAVGASKYFDLEAWAPHIELHELPGTHFGLLNPDSGLAEVINGVLQ